MKKYHVYNRSFSVIDIFSTPFKPCFVSNSFYLQSYIYIIYSISTVFQSALLSILRSFLTSFRPF